MSDSAGNADQHLAALLLTNQLTRVDVPPLRAREFWAVVEHADGDLAPLLAATEDQLAGVFTGIPGGIDAARLRRLLDATRSFAFDVERLAESGIDLVSALDPTFPALLVHRLGDGCPPFLFAAGPRTVLTQSSLAIVGVDTLDTDIADVVRAAVAAAVVNEWATVTPHDAVSETGDAAATVSDVVFDEALACEGGLVGVAAQGIQRAARAPAVRKLVQSEQLCLVSPYRPDAAPSAAATRACDTVVTSMATTTFVVSTPDGLGPVWESGLQAVERDAASVATWVGPGSQQGNHALVALGARPVASRAELDVLFSGSGTTLSDV